MIVPTLVSKALVVTAVGTTSMAETIRKLTQGHLF